MDNSKGNGDEHLYVYFYSFSYQSFNSGWLKSPKNKKKNKYSDIIANFVYQITNFIFLTELLLKILMFLSICAGKRDLNPNPHQVATGLNRQIEYVFTVLKFVFIA